MPEDSGPAELLPLVTEVVAAQLSNNKTPSSEVAPLIRNISQAFVELSIKGSPATRPEPAVPINK